jgi:hypothetical protein
MLTLNYQTICTLQLWLLSALETKIQTGFADMVPMCWWLWHLGVDSPTKPAYISIWFLNILHLKSQLHFCYHTLLFSYIYDGRLSVHFILSGAITGALTTPLDVMKTRLMIQVDLATAWGPFSWITAYCIVSSGCRDMQTNIEDS